MFLTGITRAWLPAKARSNLIVSTTTLPEEVKVIGTWWTREGLAWFTIESLSYWTINCLVLWTRHILACWTQESLALWTGDSLGAGVFGIRLFGS